MMQRFKTLEKLEILDCEGIYSNDNFCPGLFSKLKYLYICYLKSPNCEWLQQTFPNLMEATLFRDCSVEFLNQNVLIEFMKKNPQLRRLKLEDIDGINSSFWHAFDDTFSSDLEYLNIKSKYSIWDGVKHWSKCFPNLKFIRIKIDPENCNAFIDVLVQNNG